MKAVGREATDMANEELTINAVDKTPIPVEDTEKIEPLGAEVEKLKILLESEKQKAEEWRRKWEESEEAKEEKTKKLQKTEWKVHRLQECLYGLESENKVLYLQAFGHQLFISSSRMKRARSRVEQLEHQELVLRYIAQPLGFSNGQPIAACILFKSLRQWGSFEAEKTSIFDRIVETIGQAIDVSNLKAPADNKVLAYWLANTSSLLQLLHFKFRSSSSSSLFGEMVQMNSGGIEAQYPALLFKQQLIAFVEKIYSMILDQMIKEISPHLLLAIPTKRIGKSTHSMWRKIIQSFNDNMDLMRANYVSPLLIRKLYTQALSFTNTQLFNSFLIRRECCCFTNAAYVKAGLDEIVNWCHFATHEYTGLAWDELKHIRQAIDFLIADDKPQKTLDEVCNDLCPVLSYFQIYRISTMYWDDKYGTEGFSEDVKQQLKARVTNLCSPDFLLDHDSSISFSVNDLAQSIDHTSISDMEPPPPFHIHNDAEIDNLLPNACLTM